MTSGFNIGTAHGKIVLDASGVREGIQKAQESVRSGMNGIGQSFQTLGQSMQSWGDGFMNVGANITAATLPLVGFGIAGANVAAQFESALAEIQARTGATADEMQIIEARALELAASTQFGANEVSAAFLEILSSGSTVDEALQMLEPTLNAAAAGNMELGRTADIATNILAAYGLQAGDAEGVLDSLARASASSSATIGSLGEGFANIGPVANQFGLSVDETSAILAIFAENGISGAEAGTQLRSMLMNMTRDTPAVTAAWEELGVSLYDSQGNMRSMDTIMQELQGSLNSGNFTMEEQNRLLADIGGSYGLVGISALTSSMSIGEMQQRMSEQSGAADIAAARMDTFKGSTLSLKSAFEALQINVMRPFLDNVMRPLIDRITEIIQKMNAWAGANPELVTKIGTVVAAVSALGPMLLGVGFAMKQIGGIMSGVGTAMKLFALGPVGLVIGAVAALVAAFVTDFGGIRTWMTKNLKGIGKALGGMLIPALEEARDYLVDLWDAVQPKLKALGDWFLQDVLPQIMTYIQSAVIPTFISFAMFLSRLWEIVRPHLENFARWFLDDALPAIGDFITGTFLPMLGQFMQFVAQLWTGVAPYLLAFADWFLNTGLPAIGDFITNTAVPAVRGLIGTLQDIWVGVGPFLMSLADWFITSGLPAIQNFITTTAIPAITGFINILKDIWLAVSPVIVGLIGWFETDGWPIIQNIIDTIITPAIDGLVTLLKGIWDLVSPVISSLVSWFETDGWPLIQTVIDTIITPAVDGLVTTLTGIWDLVSPALTSLKDWFETTGWPIIQGIIDTAKTSWDTFTGALASIWETAEGPLNNLKTGFDNTLGVVKREILDPIKDVLEEIIGFAQDAIETISSIDIPDIDLPDVGGALDDLNPFTGSGIAAGLFDEGGYTGDMPTDAPAGIVHGQEYVIPAKGAPVLRDGGAMQAVANALSGLSARVMSAMNPPQVPVAPAMAPSGAGASSAPVQSGPVFNDGAIQVNANSYEEGQAAGRGFVDEVKEWLVWGGNQ